MSYTQDPRSAEPPEVASVTASTAGVEGPAATPSRFPSVAAATCKADGCSLPVKRNRKGWGMGHCETHYGTRGSNYLPPGSRFITHEGYVMVKLTNGRSRGEHRIVMEEHLGRPLERNETVHHINGVRDDNRLENLELWYSPQPAGQRVEDLIRYALTHHRPTLLGLLGREIGRPSGRERTRRRSPPPGQLSFLDIADDPAA